MKTTRRAFLKAATAVGVAVPCLGKQLAAELPRQTDNRLVFVCDWEWVVGLWLDDHRIWKGVNRTRKNYEEIAFGRYDVNTAPFCGAGEACLKITDTMGLTGCGDIWLVESRRPSKGGVGWLPFKPGVIQVLCRRRFNDLFQGYNRVTYKRSVKTDIVWYYPCSQRNL